MEVSDITGLGKLAEKLLSTLEKLSGFIFRPLQIKRIAKAKAEAVNEAIKILPQGTSIQMAKDGEMEISTTSEKAIDEEMLSNIVRAEIDRQLNTHSIIEKAIEELKNYPEDIQTSLEEDWINYWLECSKYCYDEEVQLIWAKILASEFTSKGHYSKRTLDFMKTLSKEEALLFTKFCKCLFWYGDLGVFLKNSSMQNIYGIKLIDIMVLSDLKLVNDSGKTLILNNENPCFVRDDRVYVPHFSKRRNIDIVSLSSMGKELSSLVNEKIDFTDEQFKTIFCLDNGENITIHMLLPDGKNYITKPIRTIE